MRSTVNEACCQPVPGAARAGKAGAAAGQWSSGQGDKKNMRRRPVSAVPTMDSAAAFGYKPALNT
ncbi:MAG: hypothetical protein AAGH42_13240 [Pseudomonadota bacterium]